MNITVRTVTAQAQREIDYLRKKVAELEAQLAATGGAATRAFSGGALALSKWGSQLQWAGRQLTANFTAPLALAGTFMTKWVLDNEAGMVRIRKVYGDAATGAQEFANDVDGLSQAFDLLSTKYATQRADVLAIAGDWAAAGATGGALARGVEATLQTMVLGEMDAADATEALIAIQAQYGANTEQLITIIQTLNATENTTGVTFQGLVDGMARSASAARSAGVDVDHLAAMIAAISPAAGSAGQAGNALKTIFSRMLGPTGEARDVLGAMGINIDDVAWKSLNGAERLERLADAYMHLEGAGEGMISSQAGIVSAVVASRWQINRFDVLMRDLAYHIDGAADTNGYYTKTLEYLADKSAVAQSAQKELNAVLESSPYAVKRAGVMIQNNLMKVISMLLPQILWLIQSVEATVAAFTNLDPGLQKLIIGFAAFLAVLGPPMVMLGSMAVAAGRLWQMFAALGTVGPKISGMFKKMTGPASGFAANVKASAVGARASIAQMFTQVNTMAAESVPIQSRLGARAAAAWTGAFEKILYGGTQKAIASQATFIASANGEITAVNAAQGAAAGTSWSSRFRESMITKLRIATGERRVFIAGSNGEMVAANIRDGGLAGTAWGQSYQTAMLANLQAARGKQRAFMVASNGEAVAMATRMGKARAAASAASTASVASVGMFFKGMVGKLKGFFLGIPAMVKNLWPAILQIVKQGGLKLIGFFTGPWGIAITAIITLLSLFGKQIGQFFQNIWKQAQDATSPLGKVVEQVVNIWNKGIEALHKAFQSLPEGVQSSLIAVVDMVKKAGLAVYEWFSYINPFAHHSPSLVENVTNGMSVVGKQFGLAANTIKGHMMNAYSVLKMFGTAVAGFWREYNKFIQAQDRALILETVGKQGVAAYNAMQASLKPLYADLEKVNAAIEEQAAVVARAEGAMNAAQATLDKAQAKLDTMRSKLDALGNSLDAAEQKLADFADSPIEGMRAMSDAIFDNELAQKKLRLEMLKLGDVDISDLQNQLASLQGEIEMLKGEQSSLQQSGAGSDILGAYQDQIDALEAQQGAINDSVGPLNEMQKQLEELQRAGEILDLENAIQFDPLQRQIDQLSESYSELPFDQIMAGITEQKAAVDELQAAYDAQNTKVEDQQRAVDQAQASVDAATAAYEAQKAVLDGLQQTYDAIADQISEIEQAIQDVIQAAQEMQSALEAAKAGGSGGDRMSPALENFLGAAGGAFPDVGDAFTIGGEDFSIDDWLDEFMGDTSNIFGSIDIFGPIKAKWNEFTGWWSSTLWPATKELFGNLWEGLKTAAGEVDWLAPFRTMLETVQGWFGGESSLKEAFLGWIGTITEPWKGTWDEIKQVLSDAWEGSIKPSFQRLGETFGTLWTSLKEAWDKAKPIVDFIKTAFVVLAGIVGGAIMLVITLVSNLLASVVTPLVEFFSGIIEAVIQIVTGLIEFIVGVFTGDWERAWQGIKDIVGGIWDTIVTIFEGAWDILWGIVEGLVNGIVDFFTWLWDVLVGHSIIPDTVEAIIEWFQTLWDTVVEFVSGLVTNVVDFFKDLYTKVTNKVSDLVTNVVDWFAGLPQRVVDAIGNVTSWLTQKGKDLIQGLKDGISNIWENVKDWFNGRKDAVIGFFSTALTWLTAKGKDILQGLKDGALDKWNKVTEWFSDLPTKITDSFKNALTLLKNAGKNIMEGFWNGLKEKWDDVTGWITGIGGWIADHKGPKAYDLALLVPAGNWIMTGLQNGMAAQMPALEKQLDSVARTVASSLDGVNVDAALKSDAAMAAGNALAGTGAASAVSSITNNKTINFNGDLSFPNITDADDAEEFLQNLFDLAGSGEG